MTNGQLKLLRDLNKCWNLPYKMADWVSWMLLGAETGAEMDTWDKTWLRRLTHQYRNQIKAMKRNQVAG